MKRILLFFALSLISLQGSLAQGPPVKDINVTGSANGFRIYESIAVGNVIYMIADDGFRSKGLWKSDGTAAGTSLVREFTGSLDVINLISAGSLVYLVVQPGANENVYLWKSDGTSGGTTLITQVNSNFLNPDGRLIASVNGTLYFSGPSGLMKTNGTSAGTVLLKSGIRISDMIDVNGKLFLIAYEGSRPAANFGKAAVLPLLRYSLKHPAGQFRV